MKRKIVTMVFALVVMIMISGIAIGFWVHEKYAYSTEKMDLKKYFDVEDGELAIFLQEERLQDKALVKNGICYLDFAFVQQYLNDGFYMDQEAGEIIYTDAAGSISATLGSDTYSVYGKESKFDGPVSFEEGDKLYMALPYVAMTSEFDYAVYDYRLQLTTQWNNYDAAMVTKDTKVRYRGGIKSEILTDVSQGDTVQILETLENWSKVKTSDSIVGYVENKFLGSTIEYTPERKTAGTGYTAPEYTTVQLDEKVCLGWHCLGGKGGNATLDNMISNAPGINVIAPTWFSLDDNNGHFRDFSDVEYVEKAHSYGLKVWATWDDFNYEVETGQTIDDTKILSSSSIRKNLVSEIVDKALELGVDGINLDFESVGKDCSEHFAQFLREISVECRKTGLTLSIDNYVPNESRKQYRIDVQGIVADYVILMGYDEHWHGSSEPGSCASIGFVNDGISRALNYVPADKLINAVPLYTLCWKIDGGAVADDFLTYANQDAFIEKVGVKPIWDEVSCQNYAEWVDHGVTRKLWLEDSDSISVKMSAMSMKDLAGIAAWQLSYGTPEIWELISSYKDM